MTDILTPPVLLLDTFMCSQSGNLHDLSACSEQTNSCILRSDTEPDSASSLSGQGLAHPPLHPEMELRFLSIPPADDVRFHQDPDNLNSHHSPVYSEPTIPTSAFLPYTNIYHPTTYSSGGSSYFSPASSIFSVPDLKPRLGSINPFPGMAASRPQGLPHLASPQSTRGLYTGPTPNFRRTSELLSRSPPSSTARGVPLSPSSSGFTSPTNMENSLGAQASPPLHSTEVIYQLQTTDGQMIRPEIFGKIDKGFFMADNDWTCYRRNYFSLNCSYTLHPALPTGTIHLVQPGGSHPQVYDFAISIAAVVDGRDGKAIELVQHTPKRDKGPQDKPSRITLAPRPPPSLGMFGGDSGLGGSRGLYDQGYTPNSNQQAMEATFERIQFKNATANNGKRRAAQQYYHLLVELFADVGQQHPDRWIKIATRMSAPMVVRGRSPGHYQNERRGSNASTGPGSGGAGGGGAFSPTSSTSRTPGDMNIGGSSMPSASSYRDSYDTRSHHYRSNIAPLQIPMEPTMSAEEAKSIEEAPGYLYYAAPIWEGNESRYLPGVSEYSTSKIKQEYSSGYTLPSLMNNHDGFGRHCGRWDGVPESKGYFPTALIQQELNIT